MLTQLIEDYQDNESDNAKAALRKWNAERDQLRFANSIKFISFLLFKLTF